MISAQPSKVALNIEDLQEYEGKLSQWKEIKERSSTSHRQQAPQAQMRPDAHQSPPARTNRDMRNRLGMK
jgi:hypothetical protein